MVRAVLPSMGRQGATDGHFDREGALFVYIRGGGRGRMNLCHQGRPCGDIRETCLEMMRLLGNTPCWRLVGTTGMASPVTKILLLGPIKAGKSAIATFLGETSDWEANETYRPTKGVRIIDFESREGGYRNVVEIELWDCSGDIKYRDCWPAMKDDAQGVILVADPDENTADDLLPWYNEFVQKAGIDNQDVLVLLNEKGDRRTNQENIAAFKLIKDVKYLAFNLRHEGDILRENISAFILKIRRNE